MSKPYVSFDNLKYFYLNLVQKVISKKVDKTLKTGSTTDYKVLSDNNYSDTDKDKVSLAYNHATYDHAPVDAEKNVQSDWNETNTNSDAYIKNKPTNLVSYDVQTLSDVQKAQVRTNIGAGTSSFSGNYDDLTNKPVIPEGSTASTTLPKMDGTASAGTEVAFARGDHSHPSDTSKQNTTNTLTEESALADADTFPFYDNSATAHRKVTWSNIVETIRTALGSAFAPKSHTHGSITNEGKIGTTGGQVITTGSDGTLTATQQGNVTVSFNSASTKANIATGESVATILGKLSKWYTSFGDSAWKNVGTTSGTVASGDHTHTTSAIGAIPVSEKGAANGIATLGSDGKIPSTQLPSYVDDVVEGYYKEADGSFYAEPTYLTKIVGETSKIYVDLSTNNSYRYGGTSYVLISSSDMVALTTDEIDTIFAS